MNSQPFDDIQIQNFDYFTSAAKDHSRLFDHQEKIFNFEILIQKKNSVVISDSLFPQVEGFELKSLKNIQNSGPSSECLTLSASTRSNSSTDPLFRKCSCTKTRCLKNYCECFKLGIKCNEECECLECKNQVQLFLLPSSVTTEKIKCKCKKSRCLKNYCECHSAGKKCGEACNCIDCNNGSQIFQEGQTRKRVKSDPLLQFEDYLN